MILAPFLIFGWGTGAALGVAGAALSSLVAVCVGTIWLAFYFLKPSAYLHYMPSRWKPQVQLWGAMLKIGLPAGAEFALTAVYLFIVYTITRPFGAAAQAGFGIGLRLIQAGFMPIVALGFAVAPVAGQNFGARQPGRVKHTFRSAAILAASVMGVLAVVCNIAPAGMVRVFSADPQVVAVGEEYLRIVSWTFLASGVIFVSSSMFQAMGNTIPPLITSFTRILIVSVALLVVARMPGFQLRWVWYISVVAVWIQLVLSMLMLRREYRLRLAFEPMPGAPAPAPTA
jgi:Na+-driven multidrug efflux pump